VTPSTPLFLLIAIAAPMLVLIVIGRAKAHRRRAALPNADATAGSVFEPQAERDPSFLLRRFTLPQRTYIGQQYAAAWVCFLLFFYLLFVVACIGLLPDQRFPVQLTMAGYFAEALAFVASVVVVTTLKTPSYATFNRTRPLTYRFLFWARALVILASFLAAIQAAFSASTLLFIIIYGPVGKLASVRAGSILRLDLSMLTTTALVFSIFVFLSFLPLSWPRLAEKKWILLIVGGVAGSQAVFFSRFLLKTPAARALFLFPAQAAPSAYTFALVPLVCVAVLLFFAERLASRLEI